LYYHVEGVSKDREGKPAIMRMRDYNGDGKALEFALFDALACMGLETTLIGYSAATQGDSVSGPACGQRRRRKQDARVALVRLLVQREAESTGLLEV
jgi:hypothetical protein